MRLLLFLPFFLCMAADPSSIPSHCQYTVQHAVTRVFHLYYPICFQHVSKEVDVFCKKFSRFEQIKLNETFIIAFGSSGVVYKCTNQTGTLKAVFQHCRTPAGGIVKAGRSEEYNEKGDSTYCIDSRYEKRMEPLLEFNNREGCMKEGGVAEFIKVGQKSSDGELECSSHGKSKAMLRRIGCNTRIGFLKVGEGKMVNGSHIVCIYEPLGNRVPDMINPLHCNAGGVETAPKDDYIKGNDGVLWYRCKPSKSGKWMMHFSLKDDQPKEEFYGCVTKRVLDPIFSRFFYKPGDYMKEYGQKCSVDLKVKPTGKEKFCSLNGIQYEVGTWLRVIVSFLNGHFFYCEDDKIRPKNVFRGCFFAVTRAMWVNMVNGTTSSIGKLKEMNTACGKVDKKKHEFDYPLFDDARTWD